MKEWMMENGSKMQYKMGLLDGDSKSGSERYRGSAIRWLDEGDHYELIFTDDFVTPSSNPAKRDTASSGMLSFGSALLTDILLDMRNGNKLKEVHVFVGSYGGEVAALSMILQQLLTYKHRVGINLGTACSCGWMLLFACQERYVSPFSQAMYHDMSALTMGKHSELRSNAEFMAQWQKELLHTTDTQKVLTEKELELGRTSEVWFTGKQLIDRKAAKDYSEYLTRRIPNEITEIEGGRFIIWLPAEQGWAEFQRVDEGKTLSFEEALAKANPPVDADKKKSKQEKEKRKE